MFKIYRKIKTIFGYFLNFLILIFIVFFNKTNLVYATNINWVAVSKTPSGIQYLDKESLTIKDKGIIEIKTKYLKIDTNNSESIEENIYLMRINCLTKEFKDVSVNGKKNLLAKWEAPNGDKLLDDVILNSCKTV